MNTANLPVVKFNASAYILITVIVIEKIWTEAYFI